MDLEHRHILPVDFVEDVDIEGTNIHLVRENFNVSLKNDNDHFFSYTLFSLVLNESIVRHLCSFLDQTEFKNMFQNILT